MAAVPTNASPTLAERTDIHKSCKSLETLLSVVNDYCEAAGAVVMLQKKLAKALKDTAGLKVTARIPANAINTTANVFEALSEINAKFTKLIDKEYDAISVEVQKWFKKLAKEEKLHDDKMEKTNVRIKQAGQLYEKKSKKNPREAVEEHARYIQLLSTLGPEVSQEKYNHALQITQRHTTTTYSVAAFVSRMADAEWLRTCEAVRRFAAPIGQLGEWRALCEGGWTGGIPQDLPPVDSGLQTPREITGTTLTPSRSREDQVAGMKDADTTSGQEDTAGRSVAANGRQERDRTSRPTSQQQQQHIRPSPSTAASSEKSQSTSSVSFEQPQPQPQSHLPERGDRSPDAHPSLESFPAPPTHLPVPLSQPSPLRQQTSRASSVSPHLGRLAESPVEDDDSERIKYPTSITKSDPPESPQSLRGSSDPYLSETSRKTTLNTGYSSPEAEFGAYATGAGAATTSRTGMSYRKLPDRREYDDRGRDVEQMDTGESGGSIVAAMRRRYSQQSGNTSPPPKDVPRLPLSVTDLASRYQPIADGPSWGRSMSSPPPSATTTTTGGRQLPVPPVDSPYRTGDVMYHHDPGHRPMQPQVQTQDHEQENPGTRMDRDIREREQALRAREREVEMRARELDRERARLTSERMREGGTSVEFPMSSSPPSSSSGTGRLGPPASSPPIQPLRAPSPRPRPRHHSLSQGEGSGSSLSGGQRDDEREHAAYCGCERCSVQKYKVTTSAQTVQMQQQQVPVEKSKSWMRRLSMPSGMSAAFSLDSKKGASGAGLRNLGVLEDGRRVDSRRSYEANSASNWSLTGRR